MLGTILLCTLLVADPGTAEGGGVTVDDQGWAVAKYERVPTVHAQRPLTTPWRVWDLFVSTPLAKYPERDKPLFGLVTGASYGITRDIDAGIVLWPVLFDDGLSFGPPVIFGTYRLLSGSVELGASGAVALPLGRGDVWSMEVGVPVLVRAGRRLRVDTGPRIAMADNGDGLRPVISAPVELSLQLAKVFRITAGTAVRLDDFERVSAPITAGAWFTKEGRFGADVDFGLVMNLEDVISNRRDSTVDLDAWSVGFTLKFFLYRGQYRGSDQDYWREGFDEFDSTDIDEI